MENIIEKVMDFTKKIVEILSKKLGNEYNFNIQEVTKNNGIRLVALIIKKEGESIAPIIYMDYFYAHYMNLMSLESIADEVYRVYKESIHKHGIEDINLQELSSFNGCKPNIFFKVVNKKANKDLLRNVPYKELCEGLVAVFYVLVFNNNSESGSFIVKNDLLRKWNISVNDLYLLAKANTPRLFGAKIFNIEQVLENIPAEEKEFLELSDINIPFFVCTTMNQTSICPIFYDGLLKDISREFGSDFWIIPSSIYEAILVPKCENLDPDHLAEMVYTINRMNLSPEKRLSDNIYQYTSSTDSISIVK